MRVSSIFTLLLAGLAAANSKRVDLGWIMIPETQPQPYIGQLGQYHTGIGPRLLDVGGFTFTSIPEKAKGAKACFATADYIRFWETKPLDLTQAARSSGMVGTGKAILTAEPGNPIVGYGSGIDPFQSINRFICNLQERHLDSPKNPESDRPVSITFIGFEYFRNNLLGIDILCDGDDNDNDSMVQDRFPTDLQCPAP